MNIPTLISLLRGFLALFFFSSSTRIRFVAVIAAAVTDFLDGYFARKWNQTSRLGTFVDPLMDKFFVMVALYIFYEEKSLSLSHIVLFLLRDISLICFICVLLVTKSLHTWKVCSFFCGKAHTAIQFIALVWLSLGLVPFPYLYWTMGVFGVASFFELLFLKRMINSSYARTGRKD